MTRRARSTLALLGFLTCIVLAIGSALGVDPAAAQEGGPSEADSARLLGYLWADGSQQNDGSWDLSAPSGAQTLVEELVNRHDGVWIDRQQLIFELAPPFDWQNWTDGLPDDDEWVQNAVQSQHFLAAVLEGEGQTDGQVYDQSACCTPGFTAGRLTALRDLLHNHGYESAAITIFGNPASGEVRISGSDIAEVRAQLRFVCPVSDAAVRIAGGTDYGAHGPLRWFGPGTRWADFTRDDCAEGAPIPVPAPVEGTCTAHVDADARVTLVWNFPRGDIAIRRGGVFQDRVSALADRWSQSVSPGMYEYSVRSIFNGVLRNVQCGTVDTAAPNPPPPPGGPGQPPPGSCRGIPVTILGTDGDDVIAGTSGNDVIDAGAGHDLVFGFDGNDIICGGRGRDRLFGGDGRDRLYGDAGFDQLFGEQGRDKLVGNLGDDRLLGSSGIDVAYGGPGNDHLDGAGGDDLLFGQDGDDVLIGGRRFDRCEGGPGSDDVSPTCELTP